jgi:hypothetical protein
MIVGSALGKAWDTACYLLIWSLYGVYMGFLWGSYGIPGAFCIIAYIGDNYLALLVSIVWTAVPNGITESIKNRYTNGKTGGHFPYCGKAGQRGIL